MNLPLRRACACAVAFSILLACPGLAPYAAAQSIRSAPAASAASGAPAMAPAAGLGGVSVTVPSLIPSAMGLTPSLSAPSAPAPSALAPVSAAKALAVSPVSAAAKLVAAVAARPAALTPAASVSAAAKATVAALEKAGPIANASPSSASGVGRKLEDVLTGALSPRHGEDLSAPAIGDDSFLNESRQLARPAGDSIAQAASAHNDGVPPTPPADMTPAPRGPQGPFWPRLLSAALALAPAVFLGLPMLASSAYFLGGLVVASSLSLAAMPFMSESTPKTLRAAPGIILLGVGSFLAGVSTVLFLGVGLAVAPAIPATGALAILGGWGLTRYGLGKSEGRYGSYGSVETLSAFFGGLAALTGAALALSSPLGWAATGLLWLSYPLSALLWFHLPSWVGKGVSQALDGFWHGAKGLSRVLTAMHRDTVLLDRLQNFSKRHWTASKWNAVWLAVVWTPILLGEAAMYVLSALGGLFVGAVTAPVDFLWGAAHKLGRGSKAEVYFAEAARLVFDNVQNGKNGRFNPLEKRLIPVANSPKFLVSALGSLGLRALQLGWLAYAVVATPLLSVAGLVLAFGRIGAYSDTRHNPDRLRVDTNDSPSAKPTEPGQPEPGTPAKAPIAPKLIAVALALVPAYFFGLPVLAGHSLIQIGLYFSLILPLAAMPFMGPSTPGFLKSFAGKALFYNGLFLLLNGNAIWVGLIALLGGWGFQHWVKKTQDKDGGYFDEAELGAFFGALGAAAAVGAVWAGFLGGWIGWGTLALAAATSPFLLMHLPEYFWEGVRGFFGAFGKSIAAFADVAAFWSGDTEFRSNLKSHANYWLKKTYWNGVWLSAIWVPTGVIQAAEYVVSAALGVVFGLLRAPFAYAAAAYGKSKPGTKRARFSRGLIDGWLAAAEGSKKVFDRLVSGLKPAMNEKTAVTGRPTAKAAGAFLLARFVQLLWLAGVLVMNLSGAAFAYGLYKGVRAATTPPPAPEA